jgi:hypothetical protein
MVTVTAATTMRYRSHFVVGIRRSDDVFICETFNRELLILEVVPRNHIVIFVGDVYGSGIAALIGNS